MSQALKAFLDYDFRVHKGQNINNKNFGIGV